MSKVVVLFEFAGMTHIEYDAICNELMAQNKMYNENRPAQVSFERDGKWCVVDVWNSAEAVKEFAETALIPAFKKLGINPPQPTILPAHSWVGLTEELVLS
jgi:hypothetical protein